MKKLLLLFALPFMAGSVQGQVLSVSYSSDFSCNASLFFAVRTELPSGPAYRLTVYKDAAPGASVLFDLDTDMSEVYMNAVDFTDPTRPMFGGSVGNAAGVVYYDAGMDIGTKAIVNQPFCTSDKSGKIIYTRDGEFHFAILNDMPLIPTQ